MLLFLLLLALVFAQHTIHVLLVEQQLAHLIARTLVFGIRRLFSDSSLAYSSCKLLTEGSFLTPSSSKAFFTALWRPHAQQGTDGYEAAAHLLLRKC